MAGFCSGCGFPLGENGAFCPQCGMRHAVGESTATPQPAAPPLRAAASGSGLKIFVVVLVCIGVAGAAAIGGLWYIGHRLKAAVVEKAKENGVDLHSIAPPAMATTNRHKIHQACELLSQEEAARVLGQPIVRTGYQESGCMYYGPPGLAAKLAQEQASETFKRTQGPNPTAGGTEVATAVDQLANSLGAAGPAGSGGEMPLLMLIVSDGDGRTQMTALNASNALFSGFFKAADPDGKGARAGGQIQGLGDQAVRLPKLGLNVLQGDTIVRIVAGPVPDADTKSVDIARLVLKRL